VLIDDSGKAVLCDFGLTRIRADVTSRTSKVDGGIIGSRNWMAPELLLGGSLKKPSDIYAFGMTIYEVSFICLTSHSLVPDKYFADFRKRNSAGSHQLC
jgi:serine/threonine protein kinase